MSQIGLEYSWDIPKICLWNTHRMPEIYPIHIWDMTEIHLNYVWNVPEICHRYAWYTLYIHIPKILLRCTWDISEIYRRFAWDWLKICLRYTSELLSYTGNITEVLLRNTWGIIGIYLLDKTQDISNICPRYASLLTEWTFSLKKCNQSVQNIKFWKSWKYFEITYVHNKIEVRKVLNKEIIYSSKRNKWNAGFKLWSIIKNIQ